MTPDPAECPASLYDGQSAVRRDGVVRLVGGSLVFIDEFGCDDIEHHRLFALSEKADRRTFGHKDSEGWRLRVARPLPPAIDALLPGASRYGGWVDRLGLAKAGIVLAAFSAGVVFLILSAPEWIAPLVPMSVERKIGAALASDVPGGLCTSDDGEAALKALTERLDRRPGDLDVAVVDVPIVNAVALPGGGILLFEGLIDKARSPDEVAGVLGHEIGHVRKRHVMASLLRQFGFSVMVSGSDLGATAGGLLSLRYSRKAEAEADQWSLTQLRAANISPRATADFFDALAKQDIGTGEWMDYVNSHPASTSRSKKFADSVDPDRDYRPALSAAQWKALKHICETNTP